MANITKTPSGKFRFIVTHEYKQHSKTVKTKAEGYIWEENLKAGIGDSPNMTFAALLEKYRDEVTTQKPGHRQETIRINRFLKDKEFVNVKITDLTTHHFDTWKIKRLKEVSALSVLREIAILNPVFNHAKKTWKYLRVNPLDDLSKPSKPPPRDRLITDSEIKSLCFQFNYAPDAKLETITSRVGAAFLFAIETAFRAKELCNLRWVDVKGRVAKIHDSKTYAGIREVPLSKRAMEILKQCKGVDDEFVFKLRESQLDSLFRKCRGKALIEDMHFHDTRHLAITRLASKLDVLELARMVGHKDLKMLLVYYNKKASDLVKKLD